MAENESTTVTQEMPAVAVKPAAPRPVRKPENKSLPPYNVVLLDDDQHTYQYVIEMLGKLFGYPVERAYQLAREVDLTGRVIVRTTHKERAELNRDQIHAYGRDVLMATSVGSMSAIIEPAMGA